MYVVSMQSLSLCFGAIGSGKTPQQHLSVGSGDGYVDWTHEICVRCDMLKPHPPAESKFTLSPKKFKLGNWY